MLKQYEPQKHISKLYKAVRFKYLKSNMLSFYWEPFRQVSESMSGLFTRWFLVNALHDHLRINSCCTILQSFWLKISHRIC